MSTQNNFKPKSKIRIRDNMEQYNAEQKECVQSENRRKKLWVKEKLVSAVVFKYLWRK